MKMADRKIKKAIVFALILTMLMPLGSMAASSTEDEAAAAETSDSASGSEEKTEETEETEEKDEKEEEERKNPTLVYGEDGVVYDKLHGKQMEGSFFCNKDGVVSKENTNTRLITVTPERRQQLVEAYHDYMKKAQKSKKRKK